MEMAWAERGQLRRTAGFTVVELLISLGIMALLFTMAVPTLSKLNRTSKVQEAANTVIAALYQARSEAQRYRTTVSVFIGDDPAHMSVTPPPGILPPQGQMEIWAVRSQTSTGSWKNFGSWNTNHDDMITCADDALPYYPPDNTTVPPVWYPFHTKDMLISDQPVQLPEGVRVISGVLYYTPAAGVTPAVVQFAIPYYQKSPLGVVKQRQIIFNRTGCATMNGPANGIGMGTYLAILVFDGSTGEHQVIQTGHWYAAMRPRIFPLTVTHVGTTKLTDFKQLNKLIDEFPPDN
jgi:Tfp pilus assembly protein FimT